MQWNLDIRGRRLRELRARHGGPLGILTAVLAVLAMLVIGATPAVARSQPSLEPASLAVAQPTNAPTGGRFVDDDGSIHESAIDALAAAGVTVGCGGLNYCPKAPVTRAEMATFLFRALTLGPGPVERFSDDDGSIHEGSINAIAAEGITVGCGGTNYCPNAAVTRAEMATFLGRALALPASSIDRFTDDDTSIHQPSINAIAAAGITVGCGGANYCPAAPVTREEMASFLSRALQLPQPGGTPALVEVATGLSGATFATSAPGDRRLYVAEKSGRIRIIGRNGLEATPFLDISGQVSRGSEQGLLGLAFHPDYATNRRFFISYTNRAGDTRVEERRRNASNPNIADTNPVQTVLAVAQPATNHNGGMIEFGPDGMLYIGLGDGGGADDPNDVASNLASPLGKLLRLDVNLPSPFVPADNPFFSSGDRDTRMVWASGLRNPWRFAFDAPSAALYIADVGQGAREEVNVVLGGEVAIDYGWDTLEGTRCHEPAAGCSAAGTRLPVLEYSHAVGQSITGGYVYRGQQFPALVGHYFYGDAVAGWIRSFRIGDDGRPVDQRDWTPEFGTNSVWSFGTGAAGELYMMGGSSIYKMATR